jgi:multidrug efflux system outer membrane protein
MKSNTLIRTAVLASLAAMLSGCFVSSVNPQKPELPLPQSLPEQATTAVQLPNPWWSLFNDATLDQLIDEALAHNADVQLAAARVAESRAVLGMTNAQRWPWLDLQGNVTRSKTSALVNPVPGVDLHNTAYTVQGAASFELDLWGRYWRASQSARAQLLNTEFGREATKLSLTGDVARSYFGLIATAQQLARARDTLSSRDESLRLEKFRYDAGESDEFTFKRVEAEAAATRKSIRQLELELTQRTNAFGVLLGRSPQDLVDRAITAQRTELPATVMLPAALPSSVLEQRPDIGAAEAALNASAYDIGVARAQMFPNISLTGVFGSVSDELGDLFASSGEAWSASGNILQPLFHGGQLRSNVKRAEAVREQRKAEYSRTVQNAFREVLDALQGQALIAGVSEASAEQVSALTRATELAELRYSQGDISYLELLDVRRGLYQAEIEFVAAQRDTLLNTVDLALAVGGGLGERAEPLSARR